MPDAILLYGSPEQEFDLFHAVPATIGDPFLYVERDGRRVALVTVLDADNARAAGVDVLDPVTLGRDELIERRLSPEAIEVEICLRACRELGVGAATVPFGFPVAVADHLRAAGVRLTVDDAAFIARRRVKTDRQLEGIRRAQAAADAAMAVGADMVRELRDGLTSEEVRAAMKAACDEHGCDLTDDVI